MHRQPNLAKVDASGVIPLPVRAKPDAPDTYPFGL
jgi:hypothetical protein